MDSENAAFTSASFGLRVASVVDEIDGSWGNCEMAWEACWRIREMSWSMLLSSVMRSDGEMGTKDEVSACDVGELDISEIHLIDHARGYVRLLL